MNPQDNRNRLTSHQRAGRGNAEIAVALSTTVASSTKGGVGNRPGTRFRRGHIGMMGNKRAVPPLATLSGFRRPVSESLIRKGVRPSLGASR